jgi:hypothetical protein
VGRKAVLARKNPTGTQQPETIEAGNSKGEKKTGKNKKAA